MDTQEFKTIIEQIPEMEDHQIIELWKKLDTSVWFSAREIVRYRTSKINHDNALCNSDLIYAFDNDNGGPLQLVCFGCKRLVK